MISRWALAVFGGRAARGRLRDQASMRAARSEVPFEGISGQPKHVGVDLGHGQLVERGSEHGHLGVGALCFKPRRSGTDLHDKPDLPVLFVPFRTGLEPEEFDAPANVVPRNHDPSEVQVAPAWIGVLGPMPLT